jgi:chemotaxis protein methyltransferase CheR
MKKTIKIKPDEIQLLSKYIYGVSGIHIEASKAYLLETRLGRLLEVEGCATYGEFFHKIKSDGSKALEQKVVDAITTNETLFFRDANPFELLRHKIIPEVIDYHASSAIAAPIRIWSAACSTGQEVYSIAIVLKELLGQANQVNINLMGTDLSDAAVQQASYGVYNKFEIERGLPKNQLQRYFVSSGENWKVKDDIRSMATFRKFNLMHPFTGLGKFDIIFCRNVAIYFTLEDRKKLFHKIADALEPNGVLLIGSTESLTGVCPRFVPKRHLKSIFYQLR